MRPGRASRCLHPFWQVSYFLKMSGLATIEVRACRHGLALRKAVDGSLLTCGGPHAIDITVSIMALMWRDFLNIQALTAPRGKTVTKSIVHVAAGVPWRRWRSAPRRWPLDVLGLEAPASDGDTPNHSCDHIRRGALEEMAFSATQMAAADILGPEAAPLRLGDGLGQRLTPEQWDEAVCQVCPHR